MAKPTKPDPLDKYFRWMQNPSADVTEYFQQEYLQLNAEDAEEQKRLKENEKE